MKSSIGGSTKYQDLESELQKLKAAGYDFAELAIGSNKAFEFKLNTLRDIIPILSGHLPEIDYQKEDIERCKRFIETLSDQGLHLFVIHLFSQNLQTKDNFDLKIKVLNELADFAKSRDSILVLENTEEDLMTLKTAFKEIPSIYFCLDIGHANLIPIENYSINLINNFGRILKHIHIHDNVGGDSEKHDLHLPIGDGNINFKPIFEKLQEIKYSGNITIELYNPDEDSRIIGIKRVRELI